MAGTCDHPRRYHVQRFRPGGWSNAAAADLTFRCRGRPWRMDLASSSYVPLLQRDHSGKARQNGENVNPFGAIASLAGDRRGPWTGWIGPAPV